MLSVYTIKLWNWKYGILHMHSSKHNFWICLSFHPFQGFYCFAPFPTDIQSAGRIWSELNVFCKLMILEALGFDILNMCKPLEKFIVIKFYPIVHDEIFILLTTNYNWLKIALPLNFCLQNIAIVSTILISSWLQDQWCSRRFQLRLKTQIL